MPRAGRGRGGGKRSARVADSTAIARDAVAPTLPTVNNALTPEVKAKALTQAVALVTELTSDVQECRQVACNTLAGLLAEADLATEIIAKGLLEPLAACLGDAEITVVAEAACSLRNAIATAPDEALPRLVACGALEQLAQVLRAGVAALPQLVQDGAKNSATEPTMAALEHGFHFVRMSCEHMESLLPAVTEAGLPLQAVACLQPEELPMGLCLAAAQTLASVTEGNPPACAQLAGDDLAASRLRTLLEAEAGDSTAQLLQVHVAACVTNVAGPEPETLPAIVRALNAPLRVGLAAPLTQATGFLSAAFEQRAKGVSLADAVQLDLLEALLAAQREGLEQLANLATVEVADEGDGWEDMDEEGAIPAGYAGAADDSDDDKSFALPAESLELMPGLLARDTAVEGICATDGTSGQTLLKQLALIRSRALACITNSATNMGPTLPPNVLQPLWNAVASLVGEVPPGSDPEFALDTVHALWSLLRAAVASELGRSQLTVPEAQLHQLCAVAATSDDEAARSNAVAMLGCVAQLPHHAPHLGDIAKVLLHAATKDASLGVKAEALNSIFDAYAEPHVNEALAGIDLVGKLQASLPALKATKAARVPREQAVRLHEARINLPRFLEYKKAQ